MFDILNYTCERCGSKDNVIEDKMFQVYKARLCLKCWRTWEYHILENPDFKALAAVVEKYPDANDEEKKELNKLNRQIIRELYPVLEKWISHSS